MRFRSINGVSEEHKVIWNRGERLMVEHPEADWEMSHELAEQEIVWTTRTTDVGAVIKTMDVTPEMLEEAKRYTLTNPPTWPRSAKRPQMMQVQVQEEPEPSRDWLEVTQREVRVLEAADAYRDCIVNGVGGETRANAHERLLNAACSED